MLKEKKEAVARQYLAGRYNADICNEFGISKAELYDVLKELKIPRKILKGNYTKLPACEYCGEKIEIRNAKFCPHCGKEILTVEKCIEILNDFEKLSAYLPETLESNYKQAISYLKNYLDKER